MCFLAGDWWDGGCRGLKLLYIGCRAFLPLGLLHYSTGCLRSAVSRESSSLMSITNRISLLILFPREVGLLCQGRSSSPSFSTALSIILELFLSRPFCFLLLIFLCRSRLYQVLSPLLGILGLSSLRALYVSELNPVSSLFFTQLIWGCCLFVYSGDLVFYVSCFLHRKFFIFLVIEVHTVRLCTYPMLM